MCLSTTRDLSNTKQEFVPLARDVSVGNEMEVSGQMHAPARITPGKAPWYPLNRRLGGGGAEPVWTFWRGENLLPLSGLAPRTVERAVRRCTD